MVALGRRASPIRLAIEMRAISLSDKIFRYLADWKDADRGMAAAADQLRARLPRNALGGQKGTCAPRLREWRVIRRSCFPARASLQTAVASY
jgi:hypothetical protein